MWKSRFLPLLSHLADEALFIPRGAFPDAPLAKCPFLVRRWVQQLATALKVGQTVVLKGRLSTILKATHHQGTARQIGNVQLELRDLRTHTKHNERLRPSEDVEVAFLTAQKWNVLYTEQDSIYCMNHDSYDQISVPREIFGSQAAYLHTGMEVTVESYEGEPVIGSLPVIVELPVESLEAEVYDGMRGATLANGHFTKLPAFVKPGDLVSLNTKEGTFVKRVHK